MPRAEVKRIIDTMLADFFKQQVLRATTVDASYATLWTAMAELNRAGGKRLRPYMTVLSYQIFGGAAEDIIEVATAWELLHLCMLIHDDVIDNDVIRYGVPNIAGQYERLYEPFESAPQRRSHLAASAAILAGDVALSAAHEIILKSRLSAEQKVTALQYVTEATFAVAGGELLDTEAVLKDIKSVDALSIARFKTATYTFVGPLKMGAALAGATAKQLATIERFAVELGCAYQLIDDMLGVFGDSKLTGKTTIGDIREGKRTLLMQQAYLRADVEQRAVLDTYVGNPDISAAGANQVAEVLVESGARQAVQDQIEAHLLHCQEAISRLAKENAQAQELAVLVEAASKRQY